MVLFYVFTYNMLSFEKRHYTSFHTALVEVQFPSLIFFWSHFVYVLTHLYLYPYLYLYLCIYLYLYLCIYLYSYLFDSYNMYNGTDIAAATQKCCSRCTSGFWPEYVCYCQSFGFNAFWNMSSFIMTQLKGITLSMDVFWAGFLNKTLWTWVRIVVLHIVL